MRICITVCTIILLLTIYSNASNTYTVKQGDTLYDIALRHNTSVDKIRELNNLTSAGLSLGQTLQLPSTFSTYKIKNGDTLGSIAVKHGLNSSKDLMEFNNLQNSSISVGQVIKIPSNQPNKKLETIKSEKIQNSTVQITHTVKDSETLYAIAGMHGADVEKIKAENNLTGNSLKPGQKLIIPSAEDLKSQIPDTKTLEAKKEDSIKIVHTVKDSESLYSIARMHGSTVEGIKAENNLKNNDLKPGQKLTIPPAGEQIQTAKGEAVATEPGKNLISLSVKKKAENTHTVKSGDTLGQIAVKYGLKSSKDIVTANNLSSSKLSIGQVLVIPGPQHTSVASSEVKLQSFPTAQENAPKLTFETSNKDTSGDKPVSFSTQIKQEKIVKSENTRKPEEIITHKVKSGDTLGQIAVKYGLVSSKEIIEFNNLQTTNLSIGQELKIPSTQSSQVVQTKTAPVKEETIKITHTVKSSDTLYAIARMHGTSVDKIKAENRLIGNKLSIGQKLIIPPSDKKTQVVKSEVKAPAPKKETVSKPVSKKKDFTGTYKVRSGDTLSQIAERFSVKTNELKEANGLTTNNLSIGQKLSVPDTPAAKVKTAKVSKPRKQVHTVRKGDTLIAIAKKYGTNVAALTNYNNLSSLTLHVGDKIRIPDKSYKYTKSGNIQYRVKKGDTLSTIARNFRVTVSSIKAANGLRSSRINIGTKLTIPTAKRNTTVVQYRVKRGDTLSSIARKHGSSVSSIKRTNNLRNSYIRPGQKLKIPSTVNRYVTTVRVPKKGKINKNSFNNDNEAKNELIKVAKQYLGAPYKFGGTSTRTGIDCSAYVNKVYSFFDVNLPRTARDMYKKGHWVSKGKLQKGDLVFFTTYAKFPSHVGIYIGNNRFIHASSASKRVTITNINKNYYKKRYIGAKRISIKNIYAKKTP